MRSGQSTSREDSVVELQDGSVWQHVLDEDGSQNVVPEPTTGTPSQIALPPIEDAPATSNTPEELNPPGTPSADADSLIQFDENPEVDETTSAGSEPVNRGGSALPQPRVIEEGEVEVGASEPLQKERTLLESDQVLQADASALSVVPQRPSRELEDAVIIPQILDGLRPYRSLFASAASLIHFDDKRQPDGEADNGMLLPWRNPGTFQEIPSTDLERRDIATRTSAPLRHDGEILQADMPSLITVDNQPWNASSLEGLGPHGTSFSSARGMPQLESVRDDNGYISFEGPPSDDDPGHQYLEDELYKSRIQPHAGGTSQIGATHESWRPHGNGRQGSREATTAYVDTTESVPVDVYDVHTNSNHMEHSPLPVARRGDDTPTQLWGDNRDTEITATDSLVGDISHRAQWEHSKRQANRLYEGGASRREVLTPPRQYRQYRSTTGRRASSHRSGRRTPRYDPYTRRSWTVARRR